MSHRFLLTRTEYRIYCAGRSVTAIGLVRTKRSEPVKTIHFRLSIHNQLVALKIHGKTFDDVINDLFAGQKSEVDDLY